MSNVWLLATMATSGAPVLLGHRLPVHISADFELLATLFVFAAFFVRG